MSHWRVPEGMWKGETVVIAGNGPSLSRADVEMVRGRARLVCINDTFRLAPWADAMYFSDLRLFERWQKEFPDDLKAFQGMKIAIDAHKDKLEQLDPTIRFLRNDSGKSVGGICDTPDGVRTGRNSGFAAMTWVAHAGPARIVLIGYDCKDVPANGHSHWFGDHPKEWGESRNHYAGTVLPAYETLVKPLAKLGIEVINATPGSELKLWPFMNIYDALKIGDGYAQSHETHQVTA